MISITRCGRFNGSRKGVQKLYLKLYIETCRRTGWWNKFPKKESFPKPHPQALPSSYLATSLMANPLTKRTPSHHAVNKPRKRRRLEQPATKSQSHNKIAQGKLAHGKVVPINDLAWKPVALPDTLDDAEGFFGLEEVDDVEIMRSGRSGEEVQYRVGRLFFASSLSCGLRMVC